MGHEDSSDQKQDSSDWTADDMEWIETHLKKLSVWKRNPQLCETVLRKILPKWRQELSSTNELNNPWTKIRKRIVKELNESEPFIEAVQQMVENSDDDDTRPFTIVDLCSGFGIFSMLLSELLPTDRVDTIWLLDKQFPADWNQVGSQHISIQHFTRKDWRIPLRIRKVDLKSGRELKQLDKYVFQDSKLILVGIHLCKSLSVRAIQLYHSCRPVALLLKPCCLPGKRNLYAPIAGKRRPIQYDFANGYSFRLLDLYHEEEQQEHHVPDEETSDGEPIAESADAGCGCSTSNSEDDVAVDTLPPRKVEHSTADTTTVEISNNNNPHQDSNFTNERFSQWVQHLCNGCQSDRCHVRVKQVHIQSNHFQNQFIFCETIR